MLLQLGMLGDLSIIHALPIELPINYRAQIKLALLP